MVCLKLGDSQKWLPALVPVLLNHQTSYVLLEPLWEVSLIFGYIGVAHWAQATVRSQRRVVCFYAATRPEGKVR